MHFKANVAAKLADVVLQGNLKKAKGKFVEALAKAEVYLSSRPKDAQMRLLKGLVQRDAGKPADAISTFTRMNEDFPELPEPFNNLGVIYADQNQ